ncbi:MULTISPECIES: YgdI/YgdR family lipoprotein [Citrobacter]|uniref:YgdI/YgdR family lipoprotein n=1 Tax=Citrobacter sedlakii TaxID=67826 RepID=A0ABS0ZLL1_9ENTR|nr:MULTISPECIES: YgdI/YgdR family lipoprotein [Citrobacter]EHG7580071.1 YgdI/YgdR family lipoprotein [Citrobacter sedlakii]EHG7611622.1 YgdI/YgdR family lipoprotein [Citrobacter sedlakii]EIQ7156308.1 YgdI/YgdR family lipoprotein [Citrobacter sedlakii]EKJ8219137.1 YgdI/YgdR family lipoprotein [Citrobacter sedlakii]EKX8504648.1 YgdI/YgdR family lipoprotein [Citrobacter sedlakii]
MKKPLFCLCAGVMLFALAGCSTNYVMTTKSGQTIVTQGKPQLDKETGMTRYTDQDGNAREINRNDVAQLIEAD